MQQLATQQEARITSPQRDHSWADYLDYMEGGADVVSLPTARAPGGPATRADQPVWGVLAAITMAVAAVWIGKLAFWPFTLNTGQGRLMHPVEPVMIAIILGIIISNVWTVPKVLRSGIKFSIKKLLPAGIVLLGARLNFGEMMKVGLTGLALSLLETVVALGLLVLLGRWLNLPRKLATLLGVGTAICGGTAIVATAPVIEAEDKDVAFSVATVTLLGLIGMFALPVVGHLLDLTSKQFGVWAGLAIHQTPQVIAAGYAYSPKNMEYSPVAGDTATIVKMARVCLLAPVVFAIGLGYAWRKARKGGNGETKKINYFHLFPMFVVGFGGMALLNTLGLLPELRLEHSALLAGGPYTFRLGTLADEVSRFCIVASMAGVGLETRFSAMKQTGFKPFAASLLAVLVVAAMVLALIKGLTI